MTNTISLSIKTLKLRMERHYKLAVRHQQKGAEFEKRWREAMFPVEKQEEVIEIDFGAMVTGDKQ